MLNAGQHEREAQIIANAGRPKAVTIATNMAGRGTDIVSAARWTPNCRRWARRREADKRRVREEWQKRHDEVVSTAACNIPRHRAPEPRIDNQLRPFRRQGDPGSRFTCRSKTT